VSGAQRASPQEDTMHGITWTMAEIAVEILLGVSLKLFCDNGRIHWRDLVNDLPTWLTGRQRLAGDGLTRQVHAMMPPPPPVDDEETSPTALAAK
jgi:hypothetical protein